VKYTDDILENKITDLQKRVIDWATKYEIWTDSGFDSYAEQFDDEPQKHGACVTVMYTEGGLFSVLNGYSGGELFDEFHEMLEETDFYCEAYNHYQFCFYCKEDDLNEAYLQYFYWRWILRVTEPEYTTLHQEIFDYFDKNPKKLSVMPWRKYEILISEIFRNQGFETLLGAGTNDQGVDLRLLQKDGIDPLVTLVQVKRYSENRAVGFEAVFSLNGWVHTENVKGGIFVTSSRFLPSAKKFAARENSRITLADGKDVSTWCKTVHDILERDRSKLFTDEYLMNLVASNNDGLRGKVFVARSGFNMVANDFAIVLKESHQLVLMMKIPGLQIADDEGKIYTVGYELARLDSEILRYRRDEYIFRGRKEVSHTGNLAIHGNNKLYEEWDWKPRQYDWND